MQAEERQFVFPSGKQADVLVSKLAPGKFRVEEYLFPAAAVVDQGDIPEPAGMGWLIEADELTGGLQVRRLVEDPDVECINGRLLYPDFAKSVQFQTYSDAIVANGGRWEIRFRGIFSAYVPKNQNHERPFSLEGCFDDALKAWFDSLNENSI